MLALVGICSTISLSMAYQAIRSWWAASLSNPDEVDEEDGEAFVQWLSAPSVAGYYQGRLQRSPHLNDLGLLDEVGNGQDEEYGGDHHYVALDLPPRYTDVVTEAGLPTYEEAVGLNRVLPGHETIGSTWV